MKDLYKHFRIFLILISSSITLTHAYDEQTEKQIILTYFFDNPTIQVVTINEDTYDRIFLADCVTASNAGEPNIPSKGVYILIPPKSKIEDIEVTTGTEHILGKGFNIDPVGEPIPITYSPTSQ